MTAFSSSLDPEKKRRTTTTGVPTKCSTEERFISGWAGLPVDILGCILSKLTLLSDYDRFGAVCVSWRKASLDVGNRSRRFETQLSSRDHQGVPLLLLLSPRPMGMKEDDGYQWMRSLYDIVQRKMVVQDNFKLPALPNSRGRCCGSSHGWLIIADDALSITLLNPFYIGGGSRCQGGMIRLPPIIELPESRNITLIEEDEYISELSICKAVLSADPALAPDDYLVMVLYSSLKFLAFIKSGDKDWTYVQAKSFYGYDDVVYRNGTIYAVSCGDIYYCDTTKPFPRLRQFAPAPPSIPFSQDHVTFQYIVESPENQLLLVCRMMVPGNNNHEPRFQTTGFKIFKLLVLGRLKAWIELKTLGNYALFLGDNHSTSVLAEASNGFPRVQPNSIYFTDHNLSDYVNEPNTLRVPTDMGVFNLKDQSLGQIQYYDLGNNLSNLVCIPPPIWFLPSFPGNWA